MTEQDVKDAIMLIIPKEKAEQTAIASIAIQQALSRICEDQATDWNEERVSFSLTGGVRSKVIGLDVLTKVEDVFRLQDLYFTEAHPGKRRIEMMDKEVFYSRFSGEARTGTPVAACMYRGENNGELNVEVFPIPDQTYSIYTFVKRYVSNFDDVPESARGALAEIATQYVAGLIGRAATGLGNPEERIGRTGPNAWDGGPVRFESQFTATNQRRAGRSRTWDLSGER